MNQPAIRASFAGALATVSLIFFGIFSSPAQAQSQNDWDVEHEVPRITIVGEITPLELRAVVAMRRHLLETLSYWKARGLANPPDLEGFYYIPNWNDVRMVEVLQLMNPSIPDVKKHVLEQYAHLEKSLLAQIFQEHPEKLGISNVQAALGQMFEQYAMLRYGLDVHNFVEHVKSNSRLSDTSIALESADNAYYARHPNLDLSELLPPAQDGPTDLERDLPRATLESALTQQMAGEEAAISRRLVILPRSTQGEGDLRISTIMDLDVAAHELGHHINSTLAGENLELSLNEAFADYLAAAPIEDPAIGEFFTRASKEIARRIEEGAALTPQEEALAKSMAELGQKKALRDLSQLSTIDDLSRFPEEEAHTAANPVRSFLWQLRQKVSSKAKFDSIVLTSVYDFSLLPMLISQDSESLIQSRHVWLAFRRAAGHLIREMKEKRRMASLNEIKAKLAGIDALTELFVQDPFQSLRGERRPAIHPDYVLPEFFRSFYRTVQRDAPEMKEAVLAQAKIAMNSDAVVFKMENGREEIAFFRTRADTFNPVARARAQKLLNNLSQLRYHLERFEQGEIEEPVHPLMSEQEAGKIIAELSHPEGQREFLLGLVAQYDANLGKLQEYERTGSTLRLFVAHPVFKPAREAGAKVLEYVFRRFPGLASHFGGSAAFPLLLPDEIGECERALL